MNCPFRVNQRVREDYDLSTKKQYSIIEQYFPECEKSECPYYDYDPDYYRNRTGEECLRVAAEMVKCGIGGFEDDE